MSTRSKMIRNAAKMPKGSRERRNLLRRLARPTKRVAQKKDEFQIVDASVNVSTTLDSLEEGAVGGPRDSDNYYKLGSFKDLRSMMKAAENYASGDLVGMEWESVEPGRIETNYQSDVNGMRLSASDTKRFLTGEMEAYLCDVSLYFRFARVWTPSEREIDKVFKL